jgi:phage-related protein
MALSNYSFQWNASYLSTPFVFGGSNSPFQVIAVDGLESLPALRTQDSNRGYNDGQFSGRDFYDARDITISVLILAGNGNSAQANLNLFQQALNPQQAGTTLLQFQLSSADQLQRLSARVRDRKITIDPEYTYGYIRAQITLFAPDPRYYDDAATTVVLTPGSPTGRTYNRTYNLSYGGGTSNATTTVTNAGWATTNPLITITGPGVNPTITNLTTQQFLAFNTTLSATDTLVIDLDQKTIALNGSTARNLLNGNSQWFGASTGSTQLYFSCSSGTSGATSATVVLRNAYV